METKQKSFTDTLMDIRRGDVIGELTAELGHLVQAVRATGGSGQLLLTIKVKPASKGDVNTLMIRDEIKVKLPKFEAATTILFATEENVLQRNDPRQPDLKGLKVPATVSDFEAERMAQNEDREAHKNG